MLKLPLQLHVLLELGLAQLLKLRIALADTGSIVNAPPCNPCVLPCRPDPVAAVPNAHQNPRGTKGNMTKMRRDISVRRRRRPRSRKEESFLHARCRVGPAPKYAICATQIREFVRLLVGISVSLLASVNDLSSRGTFSRSCAPVDLQIDTYLNQTSVPPPPPLQYRHATRVRAIRDRFSADLSANCDIFRRHRASIQPTFFGCGASGSIKSAKLWLQLASCASRIEVVEFLLPLVVVLP